MGCFAGLFLRLFFGSIFSPHRHKHHYCRGHEGKDGEEVDDGVGEDVTGQKQPKQPYYANSEYVVSPNLHYPCNVVWYCIVCVKSRVAYGIVWRCVVSIVAYAIVWRCVVSIVAYAIVWRCEVLCEVVRCCVKLCGSV